MEETDVILDGKKEEIDQIVNSAQIQPLDDLYKIESIAYSIRETEKKLKWYESYKKKKIEDIAKDIESSKAKIEFLKKIILATLVDNKEKSIKFSGSCSISTRNNPPRWVINDEEEFIAWVEQEEKKGEKIVGVVETVTQTNIVKKEADKLLNAWKKSGKLEELLEMAQDGAEPAVSQDPPKVSVTISFDEDSQDKDVSPSSVDEVIPKKDDFVGATA